jgi:hypothetical protein
MRLTRERDDARTEAELMKQAGRVLEQQRDEARALLREVEWAGDVCGHDTQLLCPACGRSQQPGHAPECRLDAALDGRDLPLAEVTRLTDANTKLTSLRGPEIHAWLNSDAAKEMDQLGADNARLRALLREVEQAERLGGNRLYTDVQVPTPLLASIKAALEGR